MCLVIVSILELFWNTCMGRKAAVFPFRAQVHIDLVCPFFRCRQVQETAELVLLPYNYIVDPQLRKLHKIDLAGSIVIFDEAHNLENICEDVTSVEISSIHITLAIQELKDAIQCLQSEIEEKACEMDRSSVPFGSGVLDAEQQKRSYFQINDAAILLVCFIILVDFLTSYDWFQSQLAQVRSEFTRGVQSKKGAMFFAVCRGKVSEGIDFSDACSRAVCVVGIPFPPLMDIRIHLKRLYLNELKAKDQMTQSAEDWYVTEGYRAVNQAFGRVLRHANDFGVVALLDER
uniref:Helicase ATP-binding domain-containing protein n=1 Tax=Angiostrongylus cantonensis TaxID=6313 RepID=A0A0K0DRH0_ANGCA